MRTVKLKNECSLHSTANSILILAYAESNMDVAAIKMIL